MTAFSVAERDLLGRIAEAFACVDPVPDPVRRAAEDAALVLRPTKTWRRLELLRDNMMSAERRLGFGPGGLDVRIRRLSGDRVAVRGLVERGVSVWARWPGGAGRSLVDEAGRFDLAEVPAGPLCLAVTRVAATGLAFTGRAADMALTPWFVC